MCFNIDILFNSARGLTLLKYNIFNPCPNPFFGISSIEEARHCLVVKSMVSIRKHRNAENDPHSKRIVTASGIRTQPPLLNFKSYIQTTLGLIAHSFFYLYFGITNFDQMNLFQIFSPPGVWAGMN